MDGPPAEFRAASGLVTFTPCGDRRWRVALDGAHLGELFETPDAEPEPFAWGAITADGREFPPRQTWMAAHVPPRGLVRASVSASGPAILR